MDKCVNILSDKLSTELMTVLDKNTDEHFTILVTVNDDILKIGRINFYFYKSDKIGGSIPLKDIRNINGFNDFIVEIRYNNTIQKSNLDSILSHELHHYYNTIIRIKDNKNLTGGYDTITKLLNTTFKSNNDIKELVHHLYLSNDLEINARVNQMGVDIKHLSNDSDFLSKIKNTQPFIDSLKLLNYDTTSLKSLKIQDKQNLLDIFNQNIKLLGLNNKFKDFDQLLIFLQKRINNKGIKLSRKLSKVIGDFNIMEEHEFTKIIFENVNLVF